MPNCSVKGCGIRSGDNSPNKNITLHRLPKNDSKRKKWLDAIGMECLKTHTKTIYICSLHFEESCFNRTLNITTLRENAVPSQTCLPPAQSSSSNSLAEKDVNWTRPTVKCDASDEVKNDSSNIYQDPILIICNESISASPIPDATLETIKKLNLKCKMYRKKIKNLNEKVRRQKKKIVVFSNIIKDLKQSHLENAENIVLIVKE